MKPKQEKKPIFSPFCEQERERIVSKTAAEKIFKYIRSQHIPRSKNSLQVYNSAVAIVLVKYWLEKAER